MKGEVEGGEYFSCFPGSIRTFGFEASAAGKAPISLLASLIGVGLGLPAKNAPLNHHTSLLDLVFVEFMW